MTLEEVAAELRYSPLTIKKNFRKVQEYLKKKYGIILTKWRVGMDVEYEIEYEESDEDEE